jgi:tRNA threonylcarbamoyladenosine biosynthesis protein TsaE
LPGIMNDLIQEYISRSEEDTRQIGKDFSTRILPGSVIALFGDLGSGKTIFTKGFCEGFHIAQDTVTSPTFVIINEYDGQWGNLTLKIRHFDFYRIGNHDELLDLGLEEFLNDSSVISIIEWPERIEPYLNPPYWKISFEQINTQTRKLFIQQLT